MRWGIVHFLLDDLELFELYGVLDFLGEVEEDGDILSEFGAHPKIDDRVVKAGRFCKKAGKDAG